MRLVNGDWAFDLDDALRALVVAMRHPLALRSRRMRADPAVDAAWSKAESLLAALGLPLEASVLDPSPRFQRPDISAMVLPVAAAAATTRSHWDGMETHWQRDAEEPVFAAHDPVVTGLEAALLASRLALMRDLILASRPELARQTVRPDAARACGWSPTFLADA